jgi:hypothetical protein
MEAVAMAMERREVTNEENMAILVKEERKLRSRRRTARKRRGETPGSDFRCVPS